MILEWNILHRVDSHIEHPKNSNHLRSHSRAIMALDHSRLDLENKSGQSFAFDKFTFKILLTNPRLCKPTFYTFYTSHLRWNSTVYHTDLAQNAVFHNFSRQILHSVNIQDDQLWALSETVQKISKVTYTASQVSRLMSTKFAVNINRVTLQHNK